MKTRILEKLRNASDYMSGQAICDELGVSRTAVWKCINQLKEEGYELEAVQNKGYRIVNYPDILTESEIESQMSKDGIIKRIAYYPELDSTNNEAKRNGENGTEDGVLYVAECQTGGRGRRGKGWISPAGSGIWMSALLRPNIAPQYASMLTIVAAMAVVSAVNKAAVEEGADIECVIKWPNDIVVNKKKICGILTEMSAEMECMNFVVIGIGINVNTTDFAAEIADRASSLYAETGKHFKRSRIVALFTESLTEYYDTFIKTCDLSRLKEAYNGMLVNRNKEVKIIERNGEYTGTATGINDAGELNVIKEDGTSVNIVSGEVSVRGLYGYV